MVLDLLPFTRPSSRLPDRSGWLRYAHFAIRLGLVLLLSCGLGDARRGAVITEVHCYVIGNAVYYGVGIALACALKDNRALCRHVCPVSVPLTITSRYWLPKIGGDRARCDECDACV